MELKASDFKVNNYVIDDDGYVRIVKGIDASNPMIMYKLTTRKCNVSCDLNWWKSSGFKPIQLTEEWLIKLNYKEIQKGNSDKPLYVIDRFVLRWEEAYKFWYVTDLQSQGYMTKLEFVHEWQNFYRIMQGEELTIKE